MLFCQSTDNCYGHEIKVPFQFFLILKFLFFMFLFIADQIGLTPEEVISKIMANPEVAMAFQNPKVQAAIMDVSQNWELLHSITLCSL